MAVIAPLAPFEERVVGHDDDGARRRDEGLQGDRKRRVVEAVKRALIP